MAESDSTDFIRRTKAPRAKSDIEIDYLEKILYVIFTSPMSVSAIFIGGACKMRENGGDKRGLFLTSLQESLHGAWGGNRTRTASRTEGF